MTAPSWSAGYVSDVAYTLGFYREMAPPLLDYACVSAGVAGLPARPLRYCELGCGRGYGTALLAAANPDGHFVGIDFNPAHIREARATAERAGIGNVDFLEQGFGEAAATQGEPYDVVALHGVYSWVAPQVREDIHAFLRNRLAPGGVAYVSYNALPGWAASAPVQHLLKELADRGRGDTLARAAAGREVLKVLAGSAAGFFAQTPAARRRIEMMDGQNPVYVAHEFLNGNWQPLYVTQAMAALGEAKLTYVASATIGENRAALCVPADAAAPVRAAPDVATRELLKDFAVNKQFRRDIYVKGPTRLYGRDAEARYGAVTLALVSPPPEPRGDWPVPAGTAKLRPELVEAILAALRQAPARIADIREAARDLAPQGEEIAAVIDILIHNGVVAPCRGDFASIDRTPAQRLNRVVTELAMLEDSHQFLASPVLGSAIAASYFDRLAGGRLADSPQADGDGEAAAVLDLLRMAGKRLSRQGKALEDAEETSSYVAAMAREFRSGSLPRWRRLGIWD